MSPKIKWGLIVGGALALLNLCGGGFLSWLFLACTGLLGIAGAALAGYLGAKDEAPGEGAKAGAIAGAITGAVSLIGTGLAPVASSVIGFVFNTGIALLGSASGNNSDPLVSLFGSTLIGVPFLIVGLGVNLCVGLFMALISAGVGALAGMLGGPKAATIPPPPPASGM
jgi:hypothetical protein